MTEPDSPPRVVLAGLSGDSGKTLVTLGLAFLARERGLDVRGFKKGPDYIDAAWLTWASGHPARNLDTFLMGFEAAGSSFSRHAAREGLNLVEGNRGLYDGLDAQGTHSTAELAKLLRAPVVLVVDATKVTRTAAALVLGCQKLDPEVPLAGVVLNQIAGARHEKTAREAVESACGIPVLGSIPRAEGRLLLPGRHLGLVTPEEHPAVGELRENLSGLLRGNLDLDRVLALACSAPPFRVPGAPAPPAASGTGLRIGVARDSAFSFYYPENLEALEASGAELIFVSPLADGALPEALHALYVGGGFPETHGARLARNRSWLNSLKVAAGAGLPVYAECGGLMLLSQRILWNGERHEMAGVLPCDVEVMTKPQGHGYSVLQVDSPNPFFPVGLQLKGHEFHYSRILAGSAPLEAACAIRRGAGAFPGRDGLVRGNVWASYTHLHALATPEWVNSLLSAASDFAHRP
jgi:cobyrinic acid a,c-diamide synthase